MTHTDVISGPLGSGMTTCSINDILIRLADEGIPVRVISRATQRPSDAIREVLRDALSHGSIVQIPREDWPTSSTRDSRIPDMKTITALDEELLLLHMVRLFHVTKL